MLLVWSVLCKPKAMVGEGGNAPCHIPQGPLKYRPSDKCPEEGEGPAVTAVGSHVGYRLWGAQTRVEVVPRHLFLPTSDTLVLEHSLSGNSQHGASAQRNTRPTGHGPLGLVHSCGEALTGNGKTLAANPMKQVRNRLV